MEAWLYVSLVLLQSVLGEIAMAESSDFELRREIRRLKNKLKETKRNLAVASLENEEMRLEIHFMVQNYANFEGKMLELHWMQLVQKIWKS
jgi:cell shape-determining protein MreC